MRGIITYLALFTLVMSPVVVAEDQLPDPGILPDSPFYGLKRAVEAVGNAFTFGDEAKVERGLQIAERRLAEIQAMAEKGKPEFVFELSEDYEKTVNGTLKRARNTKQTADREQLLARVSEATMKHVGVLEGVLGKVPEQTRASIMAAKETSLTGNVRAIESLGEENSQKASEIIEQGKEASEDVISHQKYEELEDRVDEMSDETETETETATETGAGAESGDNFRMLVSDAPADIADFEYLIVHLSSTRIFSAEGGFEERDLNASFDLTKLVDQMSAEVLSTELEPGTYNKVELYVESVDAKVGNSSADVKVPSGKLQITSNFEIVEGEVTTFVFDINVVKKGQRMEYNLLPVISKSGVVGKDLDEDEVEEVTPTECNDEVACDDGYECVNGECEGIEEETEMPEETEEPECSAEIACDDGYECVNGECEEIEEPEAPENETETPEAPENNTALNETA